MANRFRHPIKRAMYDKARTMHETLAREGSGRGMAYRRGWNGHPYETTWTSYPVYRAGQDNRANSPMADDLPPVT